jgi:hypothetical protein
MTPTKKNETPASQEDAPGNAEVQEKFDEAEDKGYIGWSPSGGGPQGHDLLSGPDAPPLIEDIYTRTSQATLPRPEKSKEA